MLLDTNQSPSCKFAEDIVDYLYGEINQSEKFRFDKHLPDCSSCADELAGFSLVRSSITDWRKEEFSLMPTPVIDIPFAQNPKVHQFVESGNRSFYDKIREFFQFSPKRLSMVVGFAVLAVCIGLGFIFIASKQNAGDVAFGNNNSANLKTSPLPTTKKENPEIALNDESKTQNPNEATTNVNTNKPKPILTKNSDTPIKISLPKSNIVKVQKATTKSEMATNKVKSSGKNKRPILSEDDEDEDSLRLSDLLEEVSLQ